VPRLLIQENDEAAAAAVATNRRLWLIEIEIIKKKQQRS
jgi:hypothetical protein